MTDFPDVQPIILRPGWLAVPFSFGLSICSSATANDGSIPYGTTVSTVVVTAHKVSDDAVVTTELIALQSLATLTIHVALNYPASSGAGQYYLKFLVTLNTGATLTLYFNQLFAKA